MSDEEYDGFTTTQAFIVATAIGVLMWSAGYLASVVINSLIDLYNF